MNCEQVEELLSVYLDDRLVVGEEFATALLLKSAITTHLNHCPHCNTVLEDYQRLDHLLLHLPRVMPGPHLREKIFCSDEYFELTGTSDGRISSTRRYEGSAPQHQLCQDATTGTPPYLRALPGGRAQGKSERFDADRPTRLRPVVRVSHSQRGSGRRLRLLQMAIAVVALFTLVVGGMIGWNLWLQQNTLPKSIGGITPPAGLPDQGPFPLPAGIRSIFLRDGALWSAPADDSAAPERLTPPSLTVAPNWVVSPPAPGHSAGDLLAYLDLQRGLIHTVRSDGQEDTPLAQQLLKKGVQPSSVWGTSAGQSILHSLAWSKDGAMLAFVAAADSTDATNLYLYTRDTGQVKAVNLPVTGIIATPIWSPDGKRLAFTLMEHGAVSLFDYNTANHGLLLIANNLNGGGNAQDSLLTLAWSPNEQAPAITWSVGVAGHAHSIWLRRVGAGGDANSQLLAEGDFAQAVYDARGDQGVGSWLLVALNRGHEGDLWRVDAISGADMVNLTSGKQIDEAGWSPDGSRLDYVDADAPGLQAGTLHVVNVTTGADTPLATSVMSLPTPAWSPDGQELLYSTGTTAVVTNVQANPLSHPFLLPGNIETVSWSLGSATQFLVTLSGQKAGLYLVDTQKHTMLVEQQIGSSFIVWTEIP